MASLSPAVVLSGERNKAEWNPWWILGWYVTTIGWIVYGFWARDFSRGLTALVVLFLPQELYALSKDNDAFPPLTHVVRNRSPSWFAFPLIYCRRRRRRRPMGGARMAGRRAHHGARRGTRVADRALPRHLCRT